MIPGLARPGRCRGHKRKQDKGQWRDARCHLTIWCATMLFYSAGLFCSAGISRGESVDPTAMVNAHNHWRESVHVPPLTWSNDLASVAQQWADHLIQTNSYGPRQKRQFGENSFEVQNGRADAKQVVDAWAGERTAYDAASNTCRARCGHYTQVVWRDTTKVGCGMAQGKGREVWVCNYDPPGNVIGEKPF